MTAPSAYTVSVVSERDGLMALGPEWERLHARSVDASPFTKHAWMTAWWDAYGVARSPRVLTYRDPSDGRLVGVVPLCEEARHLPMRARRLRYLGGVAAAGLGPIAEKGADDLMHRMAADLCRHPEIRWDVLDLRLMRDADPFIDALSQAAGPGRVAVERARHVCPLVSLPADWPTYFRSLSKGLRRKVRHYRDECEKAGFRIERIEREDQIESAVRDMLRLFETRMRSKVAGGFSVHPSYRPFLEDVSRWMLREGRLRLWFFTRLGDGGERDRAAFLYQFRSGDTMYLMQQAYDPAYGYLRLSTVLTSHAIESAIGEGCRAFDFLLGADRHKFRWGVSHVPSFADVHVYAASPAGIACRTLDAASRTAAALVKSAPEPVRSHVEGWVRAARRAGER